MRVFLMFCFLCVYFQKNHSLLSNLRATNEPLSTVTEISASAAESGDDSKDEAPNPLAPRSRKKGTVELNPPNIHIEPPPPSSKVLYEKMLYCLVELTLYQTKIF